jgi:predicted dithiol-disulfide oxidoreductase (DUF899 family)
MEAEPLNTRSGTDARPAVLPAVTDRDAWQAQIDELLVREKAHTREGDAISAVRRRLPMVEVDPSTLLTGAAGPVQLIEVFEGRRQLVAYYRMWHERQPAENQCEGCTFFSGQAKSVTSPVFSSSASAGYF